MFPEILKIVSAAGYGGVEIGFRHLSDIRPEHLKSMLGKNDLKLTGLHVGGNLLDFGQAGNERSEIETVIEYALGVGTDSVVYSGLHFENTLQFNNDISMLKKSAGMCADKGLSLLYHNHNWEFEDNWKIMNALLSIRQKGFALCPDLGWVYRGGADVIDFLERVVKLIRAVHLKDFSSNDESAVFTELGKGSAPFADAAAWLADNTDGMWVVLEQDESSLPAAKAVEQNAEYGRSLFKTRGRR